MTDIEFIDGIRLDDPKPGAPDFVVMRLSIRRMELIQFLSVRDGDWVNGTVKRAKSGKLYVAVDNFNPKEKAEAPKRSSARESSYDDFEDSSIPF